MKSNQNENSYQRNYYAIIPHFILNNKELSDKAKILYGHISTMTNQKGYCWASNCNLAKIMDCSSVTISRLINKIVRKGYLKSVMIRKNKEIVERRLYLSDNYLNQNDKNPIIKNDKNLDTSYQNCIEPMIKNDKNPIVKNDKENINNINNKINNKNNNDFLFSENEKQKKTEELEKNVDEIYKMYPSHCFVSFRSLQKNSNNKIKIRNLLKNKKFTVYQLKRVIQNYLDEYEDKNSKDFKPNMKNFSTFLNNLPDPLELRIPESEEAIIQEMIKDGWSREEICL